MKEELLLVKSLEDLLAKDFLNRWGGPRYIFVKFIFKRLSMDDIYEFVVFQLGWDGKSVIRQEIIASFADGRLFGE